MFAYLVRRLFLMLVTLFGISVVIFFLLRIVPGNIVDILFDAAGYVDPADKASIEKQLGLDQPLAIQYLKWKIGMLPNIATPAIRISRPSQNDGSDNPLRLTTRRK